MTLTAEDRQLAAAVGFEEDVFLLVKELTGKQLKPAIPNTSADGPRRPAGIAVNVGDGEEAERVRTLLQPRLIPLGYLSFWTDTREDNGFKEGESVAILKTADPYAIIRFHRTDGANINVFTEDILDRLRQWESLCRLEVVGASSDWVAIVFHELPDRICDFAADVFLLCPDSVDQGTGLMRERKTPELFEAARALCPEVPPSVRARILDQMSEGPWQQVPEDEKEFVPQIISTTEMGVRLLAQRLWERKYLFLWWD